MKVYDKAIQQMSGNAIRKLSKDDAKIEKMSDDQKKQLLLEMARLGMPRPR